MLEASQVNHLAIDSKPHVKKKKEKKKYYNVCTLAGGPCFFFFFLPRILNIKISLSNYYAPP